MSLLGLTRRAGETIHIGPDITVLIKEILGNRVLITINAPRDVDIRRGEIFGKLPPVPPEPPAFGAGL